MIISRDVIPEFLPTRPKLVILGTMCSVNAREINGVIQRSPPFFYHDNRNRFWKILQFLFEDRLDPPLLTLGEKKTYLDKWGVAIGNVVSSIEIKNQDAKNASDEIIYSALKKNKVTTKIVNRKFKKLLMEKPLYFTCKRKPKLDLLLVDYFDKNKVPLTKLEEVTFLHTPTRKSHGTLAEMWRSDFLRSL